MVVDFAEIVPENLPPVPELVVSSVRNDENTSSLYNRIRCRFGKEAQALYVDTDGYHFMDNQNYEQ